MRRFIETTINGGKRISLNVEMIILVKPIHDKLCRVDMLECSMLTLEESYGSIMDKIRKAIYEE